MMNIGIVHYHLKPGGVTTVIKQHIRSTCEANDFLVICGEHTADPEISAPVVVIPELGYDRPDGHPICEDPDATAEAVINCLRKRWGKDCDLLHIHNPLLAKNRRFLQIVKALAAKGQRLLLQIHDFAENGRPGSYYGNEDYPENCHLAVINTRDREILIAAGADPDGVHYIPNAVSGFPEPERTEDSEPVMLYPVRAIRRKNLGEAVLLSLFFKNKEKLAVTLPPNSAADFPAYNSWRAFCRDYPVNVLFEASTSRPFREWVTACRGMLSTSITEGFGFAFLEPWTAGRPLFGRKLPHLCGDFETAGVDLGHLYSRLAVPTEWLDREQLKGKIITAVAAGHRAFGRAAADIGRDRFLSLTDQKNIDFGMLDEDFQQQVISRILASPGDRQRLVKENPFLRNFEDTVSPEMIHRNAQVIHENFSERVCGEQLLAAYRRAAGKPVNQRIDKKQLLARFFHPAYFSLLQWGVYDDH